MTLKGLKRKLICFVLVICLATGDWLPVLASEITEAMATEQAQEVSEESVEEAAEISEEEEISEEIVEEAPAEEPAVEVPEETPEEIPTEEPAVEVPEETPEEIPTEEPTEGDESLETPEEGDTEELTTELTEEELAAVSAFNEQLTSLDDENQIEETLVKYAEEEDWDEYESYILACVNCCANLCTSYDALNENQKVKLEDVSKLEDLEWLKELSEEDVAEVRDVVEQIGPLEDNDYIQKAVADYANQESLEGYEEYLKTLVESVIAVQSVYDILNETQKKLVVNAEKLVALEWIDELNENAIVAIMNVIEQVGLLESNEQIEKTLLEYADEKNLQGYKEYLYDSAEAVGNVKKAYDALSETQKSFVVNTEKLAALEWLLEDEVLEQLVEKLAVEIEGGPLKEFFGSIFSARNVMLSSASESNASDLEISKKADRISTEDDSYKITLTAKSNEYAEPTSVLTVLDVSGSMKSKYNSSEISEKRNINPESRITTAVKPILELQKYFQEINNGSEMGLVGFYSWAGAKPKSKNTIDKSYYHGYEHPVYVDFKEWNAGNYIKYGIRAEGEKNDGEITYSELYSGQTDANGYIDRLRFEFSDYNEARKWDLKYRTIIPDANTMLYEKIHLLNKDGTVAKAWDPDKDPRSDVGNTHDLFYQTNWEVALKEAEAMLNKDSNNGGPKKDNKKVLLFVTDGVPQTFEFKGRMARISDLDDWSEMTESQLIDLGLNQEAADLIMKYKVYLNVGGPIKYGDMTIETQGRSVGDVRIDVYYLLCALVTVDELQRIKDNNPDVRIISILVGPAANLSKETNENWMQNAKNAQLMGCPTIGRFLNMNEINHESEVIYQSAGGDMIINGVTSNVLDKIKGEIVHEYTNVVIEDKLSEYVELTDSISDMIVTADEQVLSNDCYNITVDNDVIKVSFKYYGNEKQTVMVPGVTYAISFKVRASKKAYNQYAGSLSYEHTGFGDQANKQSGTHSGQSGYISNVEANVYYNVGVVKKDQSYEVPVIQVTLLKENVKKAWVTSQPESEWPASVQVKLSWGDKANESRTVTLYKSSGYSGTFVNLPKRHAFTIEEITKINNYEATYSYDENKGYTVTNTQYFPIQVEKIWDVYNTNLYSALNRKLEVRIGNSIGYLTPKTTGSKTWVGTVNVPYDPNRAINYTVSEYWNGSASVKTTATRTDKVSSGTSENLTVHVSGGQYRYTYISPEKLKTTSKITFTNTETFDIPVEKIWSVADKNLIPEQLEVSVANSSSGVAIASTTLVKDQNNPNLWKGILEDVPYKSGGYYYFRENYKNENIETTYTRTYLNSSGNEITSAEYNTYNASNGNKYFSLYYSNLPKTTKVTFINRELIDIPVEKNWVFSSENKIPEAITFELSSAKNSLIDTFTLYKDNFGTSETWTGVFENVPYEETMYYVQETINGLSVDYKAEFRIEKKDNSYRLGTGTLADFKGTDDMPYIEKIVFTNTELIDIPVEKIWNIADKSLYSGLNNRLEVQIDGISGYLYPTASGSNVWTGIVKDVPYKYGNSMYYRIKEIWKATESVKTKGTVTVSDEITGTKSTSNWFIYTDTSGNRYVSVSANKNRKIEKVIFTNTENVSITVGKTWDANITSPPSSLTVQLFVDGVNTKSLTLSENNNWTGIISGIAYNSDSTYVISETAGEYGSYVTAKTGANNAGIEVKSARSTRLSLSGEEFAKTKHVQFTNSKVLSIIIEKEWIGVDEADQPSSINIPLTMTTTSFGQSAYLTKDKNWAPTSHENVPYDKNAEYLLHEYIQPGAPYFSKYEVYDKEGNIIKRGDSEYCYLTAAEFLNAERIKYINISNKLSIKVAKEWYTKSSSNYRPSMLGTVTINANKIDFYGNKESSCSKTLDYTDYLYNQYKWYGTIENIPISNDMTGKYVFEENYNPDFIASAKVTAVDGTILASSVGKTIELLPEQMLDVDTVTFINKEVFNLTIEKEWITVDTANIPDSLPITVIETDSTGAEFYYNGTITKPTSGENISTTIIPVGYNQNSTYKVVEKLPLGYELVSITSSRGTVNLDDASITFSNGNDLEYNGIIRFTNRELIDVTVNKTWIDGGNQPYYLDIALNDGTKTYEARMNSNDGWSYTFEDIPYDPNANYTISEKQLPGYVGDFEVIDSNGTTVLQTSQGNSIVVKGSVLANAQSINITNKPAVKLTVHKDWLYTPDVEKEEIIISLLEDYTEIERAVLNETNNWTHVFLIPYKQEKTYRIQEVNLNEIEFNNKFDTNVYAGKVSFNGSDVVITDGKDFATDYAFLESAEIVSGKINGVIFKNRYVDGELTVEKQVKETYGDETKEFDILIKLFDENGDIASSYSKTIKYGADNRKSVTFTHGEANIKLKSGENITLTGIPTGYSYEIIEDEKHTTEEHYRASYVATDKHTNEIVMDEETGLTYGQIGTLVPEHPKQIVTVTNERSEAVVTGIFVDNNSNIMLLGAALVGTVAVAGVESERKKRKKS